MNARKSKIRTSLNFTFKSNTSYLVSILFTRVKFTSMLTHVKITRQWKSTLKDKTPLMDVKLLTELQFGFDKGSPIKSPKKGLFRFSEISLLFAVEQALFVRILQASEGKRKASEEH